MTDLDAIKETIKQLSPSEFNEILTFMLHQNQGIRPPVIDEDPETRLTKIREAIAAFREGLSEEELEAMIEDMNYEYIEPEYPELFGWIDDLPEDER